MKIKFLPVLLLATIFIATCAPAAVEVQQAPPAAEEAAQPSVDEVAEPSEMEVEETETDESMVEEVSFSEDIWPIIESEALPAHGGAGGVFLESYEDVMDYVVPGNPEDSLLYKALIGDEHRLMPPPPAEPFSEETIQLFYDWIAQGAKNN